MKKSIIGSLLALSFAILPNIASAQFVSASASVVCPEGYTCTLTPQFPATGCPVGYTCTPNTINTMPIQGSFQTPCYTFTNYLTIYDTGRDVVALQTILTNNGFATSDASGTFGASTQSAVRRYQTSLGLPSTGYIGPLTIVKLNSACGSQTIPIISNSNTSSTITVINPKAGDVWMQDTAYTVSFTPITGDFDQYSIRLANRVVPSTEGGGPIYQPVSKNIGGNPISVSFDPRDLSQNLINAWLANARSAGDSSVTEESIRNNFYYHIVAEKTSATSGKGTIVAEGRSGVFNISKSTSIPTAQVNVTAQLLSTTDDKAGTWSMFAPGMGNINKNQADWNWSFTLNNISSVTKTVKRITIKHATAGEVWSTGYSRYLNDGTDLYAYNEHPYPLVTSIEKGVLNTSYDQAFNYSIQPGSTMTDTLYGQKENTQFTGGRIYVEFTDGTFTTTLINAGNYSASSCPTGYICGTSSQNQTATTPVITSISPTSASAGQSVTIYGTNFTSTENTVYIKTQNTTSTVRPGYQGVGYVQFTLPSWATGPTSFAVENGRLEISPYVNFTVTSVQNSYSTLTCPLGYICEPYNTNTTCPTGYTCGSTTENCPAGYNCYKQSITYSANAPAITSISPTSAYAGQSITIYGNNFTSTENTVYIRTQNTVSSVRPGYQGTDYVKFTLPSWAIGPTSFAVENGRLELSSYVNFTVLK